MAGKHSRRKGADGEREIVALARAARLQARRCWETAQHPAASERVKDVEIAGQPYQVQIAQDGFERIYRELEGVRGFIFRRDRGEWLVSLRLADYLELLRRNSNGARVAGKRGAQAPKLNATMR